MKSRNGTNRCESRCGRVKISVGTASADAVPGLTPWSECAAVRSSKRPGTPGARGPAVRSRILVLDDQEDIAEGVARMLSGHDVTVETDAVAAIAMLAAGDRFDVIISDLNMPLMTGDEVHDAVTFWSALHLPQ